MIKRESYLEQIRPFIDKPFIKVLTGIRRSGKSAVLMMIQEELIDRGVDPGNIISINFESMIYSDLSDSRALFDYIRAKITDPGRKWYIFLDEIQEVLHWEKAVTSFLVDFDADLYITGSNSKLLSSELSTYIAGRYIEISVYPLSFREFLDFRAKRGIVPSENRQAEFVEFLRLGGFPAIHLAEYDYDAAYKIVNDIYASAILRDSIQRFNIRNIELLERIVKYALDNVGNIFSAKKIADYFKSQMRKADLNTVYNYLQALESAFIIQRVPRYDLKGHEILKTNDKYFAGDPSIKYAVLGYRDRDISGNLENIVYLELKRRGYKVYIGKLADREVDFVAEKSNERIYVQVAYKLPSPETVAREYGPLKEIRDSYPKYVVTMEDFWQDNIDGIKHRHIAEFLLQKDL